jgi:hypothetical protein
MGKEERQTANNPPAQMSISAAYSQKLLQCLIDVEANKQGAKMELILATNELMPEGKPNYLEVVKYPMIRQVIQTEGRKKMLAVLVSLVKNFCASMNVVRNMNEDQMIETAAMLLEECGNFRLEDYVTMFSMAKRGSLIKIYDRIDIQVVTEMLEEYWERRNEAGKKNQEAEDIQGIGSAMRQLDSMSIEEQKNVRAIETFAGALSNLSSSMKEFMNEK